MFYINNLDYKIKIFLLFLVIFFAENKFFSNNKKFFEIIADQEYYFPLTLSIFNESLLSNNLFQPQKINFYSDNWSEAVFVDTLMSNAEIIAPKVILKQNTKNTLLKQTTINTNASIVDFLKGLKIIVISKNFNRIKVALNDMNAHIDTLNKLLIINKNLTTDELNATLTIIANYDDNIKTIQNIIERKLRLNNSNIIIISAINDLNALFLEKLIAMYNSIKENKNFSDSNNIFLKLMNTSNILKKSTISINLIKDNVKKPLKKNSKTSFFEQNFTQIIKGDDISIIRKFGVVYNNVKSNGILISTPKNKAIYAITSGVVMYVGKLPGFGEMLVINHGHDYISIYSGIHAIVVNHQKINSGEQVAISTPEDSELKGVYFELRHLGKPIDPLPLIMH